MLSIRSAVTSDVPAIRKLADPLVEKRILLGKELVELYESIQEFVVAELDGELVGFGALHVMWRDLGEVRTLAVSESAKRKGVGTAVLSELLQRAKALGIKRVFCLTFERDFLPLMDSRRSAISPLTQRPTPRWSAPTTRVLRSSLISQELSRTRLETAEC